MKPSRQIRYRAIAEELRAQIAAGSLAAGAVLPSEADLAGSYGVSRVTVRKALEVLREEGLVDARQGFGWFVAGERVRQSLAVLGTIEQQLAADGRDSTRRVVSFGFVAPPERVARILGGDEVLEVVRLNVAAPGGRGDVAGGGGQPFALVTVWCPAAFGSGLSRDQVEAASFHELLPVRLTGAEQTIGAAAADDRDHRLLDVPVGSPLLVCERTSLGIGTTGSRASGGGRSSGAGRSADGEERPVLVSEHRFPAHLTEFVVDLGAAGGVHDDPVRAPGLRLVDGTG